MFVITANFVGIEPIFNGLKVNVLIFLLSLKSNFHSNGYMQRLQTLNLIL